MNVVVNIGFKHTEIGMLPVDWEAKKLGELASFRTGPFGSALHKSDYINDGIPIVNPMHILDGRVVSTASMTITKDAAKNLEEFQLKPGEVIIGRRGDMGRCAVISEHEEGWLCGTGSMIIRPSISANAYFLQRVLSSPFIVKAIENSSVGSTMINLNQGTLSNLVIQTPPIDEQRAIAATLANIDALISSLDRLIAKKRDIQQAAMQQLLTGQRHLPGFGGDWEVKTLSEIGTFMKGSGVTRDQSNSGELPCVRYGEIYTTHHNHIRAFQSFISKEVAAGATRLRTGDLLFAGSGETKAEIGKCVAFVDVFEAYAGGDIVILRPTNSDSNFLGYALNTPEICRQKASRGQGDAVVHISANALSTIEINLPPKKEQTAIATFLSDMDAEIATLEARRHKARQLKQGMMQELLTGRIRLV